MPVFVILIISSLTFYIFYKVKYVRSKKPIEKKWLSSKSSIALGAFVALFGINRLFLTLSPLAIAISIIFIIIGMISIVSGFKAYKYYLPHVFQEREQLGQTGK